MKPALTTESIDFHYVYGAFNDNQGKRYDVNRLIQLIVKSPRPVEQLLLEGWFTERSRGRFGEMESILVSPNGIEHTYRPIHLIHHKNPNRFPIIACQRKSGTLIVDGIHRMVKATRGKRLSYPCIYVTPKELQKCRIRI